MKIHERLNLAMSQKGIKQKELAEKLGLSEGAVSYYLHGKRRPNQKIIAKLAEILELPENELVNNYKFKTKLLNIEICFHY